MVADEVPDTVADTDTNTFPDRVSHVPDTITNTVPDTIADTDCVWIPDTINDPAANNTLPDCVCLPVDAVPGLA